MAEKGTFATNAGKKLSDIHVAEMSDQSDTSSSAASDNSSHTSAGPSCGLNTIIQWSPPTQDDPATRTKPSPHTNPLTQRNQPSKNSPPQVLNYSCPPKCFILVVKMPKKDGLVVTEGNGNMYGGHARRKHIFFTIQLQKLFLLSGKSIVEKVREYFKFHQVARVPQVVRAKHETEQTTSSKANTEGQSLSQ